MLALSSHDKQAVHRTDWGIPWVCALPDPLPFDRLRLASAEIPGACRTNGPPMAVEIIRKFVMNGFLIRRKSMAVFQNRVSMDCI
jgi:hypothetical protein